MSDKDLPYNWAILGRLALIFAFGAWILVDLAQSSTFVFNDEPKIRTLEYIGENVLCYDSHNSVDKGHGEEWSSVPGACDNMICHVFDYPSYNATFRIDESCAYVADETQNPDPTNCQYVYNNTQVFPDCCPRLQCSEGTFPATSNETCVDMASTYACETWKNLTNCNPSTDFDKLSLFNYTQVFCQLTCGVCTPIG